MKVILLEDISKIGKKYDIITISDGYAQNYLIPQKRAIFADEESVKRIEKKKAEEAEKRKVQESEILKNIEQLKKIEIEINEKANDKGHLFAGIHKEELVTHIKNQMGFDLDSENINLEKPLKEIGEHEVEIKISDKTFKLKVRINSL